MNELQATFQNILDRTVQAIDGYWPDLLAALGVLLAGWIVALVVARLVRGLLRRTKVDNRLAGWLGGEQEGEPPAVERGFARGAFWLTMLFVLVAFFHTLQLTVVTEPLQRFLEEIFSYAPRVLSAGLLLLVAWVVAVVLRIVTRTALVKLRADERIGEQVDGEAAEGELVEGERARPPISKTVSETVYWLVFLFFLPAVLGALAVQGLLLPVQSLVDQMLAFLPNLFAASLVFVLGWLVARVVQRVVSGLAAAAGVDRLAERVGLGRVLGERPLSATIGLLVYALILVPVLISALQALRLDAVTQPASAMLHDILAALPALLAAGLILAVAWIVARIVSGLVASLLAGLGFDALLARLGLDWSGAGEDARASKLAGKLAMIAIFLLASIEALRVLHFDALAALLVTFTGFLGNVLLGLVVFGLGLYLARLAADVLAARRGAGAQLMAATARVAIVILAGAMALRQVGIAEDIVNLAFGLTLGAAAVAAAIAFGIGGRPLAQDALERWRRSLRSSSPDDQA